jgi:hypothetical protein
MLPILYERNNELASTAPLQGEDHGYENFKLFCTLINSAGYFQKVKLWP